MNYNPKFYPPLSPPPLHNKLYKGQSLPKLNTYTIVLFQFFSQIKTEGCELVEDNSQAEHLFFLPTGETKTKKSENVYLIIGNRDISLVSIITKGLFLKWKVTHS